MILGVWASSQFGPWAENRESKSLRTACAPLYAAARFAATRIAEYGLARIAPGKIKGAGFREVVAWLRREKGGAPIDAALTRLEPGQARAFDATSPTLGILAATWYDGRVVQAFFDAYTQGSSPKETRSLAYAASRGAMSATFRGVHRALLRVAGSPELHARFAQRLWDTYYSDGRVRVQRVGPTESRVAHRDWSAHNPFLCDCTAASDLVIYPAMGLQDVTVEQVTCVHDGDVDCAHIVRWKR